MAEATGWFAPRPRRRRGVRILVACLLLGPLCACASDAERRVVDPERDLYATSSSRRIQAILAIQKAGDTDEVPALIEMLGDRDAAVRLTAASALEKMTGRPVDATAFSPAAERVRAQAEYRAWWAQEERFAAQRGGAP